MARFKGYIVILSILLISSCQDKRSLVVSKIKSSAKLATTEVKLNKIVLGTEERKFMHVITINQAYFAAHTEATVLAGIDLTDIKSKDINIENKKIEINLPAVKVLSFDYPFEKYRVDSTITKRSFLTEIDIYEQEELFRRAEIDIRNSLAAMGIKKTTEDKTRILITGMLENLGFEEIYIHFNEGDFVQTIPEDIISD